MVSTSLASAMAPASPPSVKALMPTTAPPLPAASLCSASRSPSSPTQGLQVVNQKFTTVKALPLNSLSLLTSLPSRSLPVKAGNLVVLLSAVVPPETMPSEGTSSEGTLIPSEGASSRPGNFSSSAAIWSSRSLISVAPVVSSVSSFSSNLSLAASMVLSRKSP